MHALLRCLHLALSLPLAALLSRTPVQRVVGWGNTIHTQRTAWLSGGHGATRCLTTLGAASWNPATGARAAARARALGLWREC